LPSLKRHASSPFRQTPRLKMEPKMLRGGIKKYENPASVAEPRKGRGEMKSTKIASSPSPVTLRHCDCAQRQSYIVAVYTQCQTVTVYTVTVTLAHFHCCTGTMPHRLTVYIVAVKVTIPPRCTHSQADCRCVLVFVSVGFLFGNVVKNRFCDWESRGDLCSGKPRDFGVFE